ncbi:MAG: hypothetical protein ACJ8BW_37795 [Ktedonobacteraceae bacterium]|jgi:hypothetical protein
MMESLISWIIGSLVSLFGLAKTFLETKKLLDEKVMPDIKTEDTAKEIQSKQELAKSIVTLAGIEAAYNIARGLVLALNFAVIVHYTLKFASHLKRGSHDLV